MRLAPLLKTAAVWLPVPAIYAGWYQVMDMASEAVMMTLMTAIILLCVYWTYVLFE